MDPLFATKSEGIGLIVCAISFQDFLNTKAWPRLHYWDKLKRGRWKCRSGNIGSKRQYREWTGVIMQWSVQLVACKCLLTINSNAIAQSRPHQKLKVPPAFTAARFASRHRKVTKYSVCVVCTVWLCEPKIPLEFYDIFSQTIGNF